MSTSSSQVITCKGAVCWGIGEGVKVEEIQVDPPKATEVRVKMLCASVCHSRILTSFGTKPSLFAYGRGEQGKEEEHFGSLQNPSSLYHCYKVQFQGHFVDGLTL
ncbi:hypothetical protein K1719_036514 [Acacia pycnantha]|nr:hypothetical protein K1719_036514 [Acacia pycnantha]